MAEDMESPNDGVGYCRPPRDSQFKPGQSGNPRGRPKGAKGLKAELAEELNEFVTITEGGKSRRVRKRRVVLKALIGKAAKGDVRAADKLLSLIIQAEGFEDQRPNAKPLSETELAMLDRISAFAEEEEPAPTPPREPSQADADMDGESQHG